MSLNELAAKNGKLWPISLKFFASDCISARSTSFQSVRPLMRRSVVFLTLLSSAWFWPMRPAYCWSVLASKRLIMARHSSPGRAFLISYIKESGLTSCMGRMVMRSVVFLIILCAPPARQNKLPGQFVEAVLVRLHSFFVGFLFGFHRPGFEPFAGLDIAHREAVALADLVHLGDILAGLFHGFELAEFLRARSTGGRRGRRGAQGFFIEQFGVQHFAGGVDAHAGDARQALENIYGHQRGHGFIGGAE